MLFRNEKMAYVCDALVFRCGFLLFIYVALTPLIKDVSTSTQKFDYI